MGHVGLVLLLLLLLLLLFVGVVVVVVAAAVAIVVRVITEVAVVTLRTALTLCNILTFPDGVPVHNGQYDQHSAYNCGISQ